MTSNELTANGAILYTHSDANPAADRSAVERGDNQTVITAVSDGPDREGQRS